MPDGHLTKQARKKEKYERRQTEVIDAAASVFAEKGYHGASTGDIAAKLGIAQSSLYYYFKSKDEALETVCLKSTKGYVERLQAIVRSPKSTDDKLREAILNHIQPIKTIPNYFRTFIGELRYLPIGRRKKLSKMITEYNALFEKVLTDGVAEKIYKKSLDCHLSMLLLISQCNMSIFWINEPHGYDIDTIAASIADNFVLGATIRNT